MRRSYREALAKSSKDFFWRSTNLLDAMTKRTSMDAGYSPRLWSLYLIVGRWPLLSHSARHHGGLLFAIFTRVLETFWKDSLPGNRDQSSLSIPGHGRKSRSRRHLRRKRLERAIRNFRHPIPIRSQDPGLIPRRPQVQAIQNSGPARRRRYVSVNLATRAIRFFASIGARTFASLSKYT